MDPIRAIVADDEKLSRELLMDYLKDYPQIEVVAECGDGLRTLQAICELNPEIVFLDIQMPELTGIDVIRELRGDVKPIFVFITAFEKYALEAFEVSATDYLLKPFTRDRFKKMVEKIYGYLLSSREIKLQHSINKLVEAYSNLRGRDLNSGYLERILVKEKKRFFMVPTKDIYFLKADGDYVSIYLDQKRHLINDSLTKLELKLDPALFVRVHRSAIVNKTRLKEFIAHFNGEYILILENGSRVKLSRSYKHLFKELIKV